MPGASGSTPSFSSSTSDCSASARAAARLLRRRAPRAPRRWGPRRTAARTGRAGASSAARVPTAASSSASSTLPVGEAVRQRARRRRPCAAARRRRRRPAPGAPPRRGRRQPVGRRDHLDAHVVGGDDPVEAPLVAQDRRQQLVRGVARHAVDVAVRRHDARDPGVPDRGLERDELLVAQLARADVRRAPGSARPRRGRGRPCAWPSRARRRRGPAPGAPRRRRSRAPVARYGSSPYVSSIRPQRGSRAMSRTGASACRAPVSSIRRRTVGGHRRHGVRVERAPPRRSTAGSTARPTRSGRGGTPRG